MFGVLNVAYAIVHVVRASGEDSRFNSAGTNGRKSSKALLFARSKISVMGSVLVLC